MLSSVIRTDSVVVQRRAATPARSPAFPVPVRVLGQGVARALPQRVGNWCWRWTGARRDGADRRDRHSGSGQHCGDRADQREPARCCLFDALAASIGSVYGRRSHRSYARHGDERIPAAPAGCRTPASLVPAAPPPRPNRVPSKRALALPEREGRIRMNATAYGGAVHARRCGGGPGRSSAPAPDGRLAGQHALADLAAAAHGKE